jgi:hypothetical protein
MPVKKLKVCKTRERRLNRAGWLGLGVSAAVCFCSLPAFGGDVAPVPLSFQAFYQSPIGPQGLVLNAQVLSLQDQWVRLSGYRVKTDSPTVGWFLLAPLPNQTSPEEEGDANDLPANTVLVWLDPAQQETPVPNDGGPLTLAGRFHWGAALAPDGQTYWFSLQLPARVSK